MNLLILKNNKIEINPETLLIKEFKAIWDSDPGKKKEFALRELAYIYFLCDYNSVYQSYSKDERSKKIRSDLSKGDRAIKLTKFCDAGIKKYEELQDTPSMQFLESAKDALASMTEYFKGVDFTKMDKNGKFVYNVVEVTRCLKDAGGVMESIEKLKEKVKTEIYEKVAVRGKSDIGFFET